MRRVVVIGSGGSGKTTLAAALAGRLNVRHVELDALYWGPNWTGLGGSPAGDARFSVLVAEMTAGDAWVVDGNYSVVREHVWSRADTIVWLDYPLPTVLRRLVRRTVRRVLTGEVLWGTNRETFRNTFFSRDSLLLYVLRTHRRRRRQFEERLARPDMQCVTLVRLKSPAHADAWLADDIAMRSRPGGALQR